MRKLLSALILTVASLTVLAQSKQELQTPRTIQVKGDAEREVTPDIAYLSISLVEYYRDSNQRNKVTIDVLEKQLYDAVLAAGIPKENFMIENVFSVQAEPTKRRKDPAFLASKQYRIKLNNLNAVNFLLESIEDQGIKSSNVAGFEYSKKDELEKELKIQAVQNAKHKAEYMAEVLGDKVGRALTVSENGYINVPQPVYMARAMAKNSIESTMVMDEIVVNPSIQIDNKKIRFRFDINILFELVD